MKWLCPAAIIWAFTSSAAHALLGETEAQVQARLGTAAEPGLFRRGGFTVRVVFDGGISSIETVEKSPDASDAHPALTGAEIAALLRSYGGGLNWDESASGMRWTRSDGRSLAEYHDGRLTFTDVAFVTKKEEADDKQRDMKVRQEQGAVADVFGAPPVIAPTPTPTPKPLRLWYTPRPQYPYVARAKRAQGSGAVQISTGAAGTVVSALIIQSAGNEILDANTVTWAKSNWNGPPNATTTVPVTYKLE